MADQQTQLKDLADEFQKLQDDLRTNVAARQKLESQLQENKSVKKEFELLPAHSNVYKSVGPVLLKQEPKEALMAVGERLAFIEKEITRVEKQISDIQEMSEKKKIEIMQMQSHMQSQQQQVGSPA